MAADPTSRACLLVRVARCVTGLVRLDPDAVLDVDQLLGVILAFGADEDVACVIATSRRPLTNSTDDAGSRHGTIFARHGRPVLRNTPVARALGRAALRLGRVCRNHWRWMTLATVHARLTVRSPLVAQALSSVANLWGATGSFRRLRHRRPPASATHAIARAEDKRDAIESPDAGERIMRGANFGDRSRSLG